MKGRRGLSLVSKRALFFYIGVTSLVLGAFDLFFFGFDLLRVDTGLSCEWQNILRGEGTLFRGAYTGNGAPFWANPHAQVLYPLRWLFVFMPPQWQTQLGVGVHLALAATGAMFVAERFGLRRRTAMWVGLSYVGCGTVVDLIGHATYLAGAAYIPWIWGAARWFRVHGVARAYLLVVAATSMCILAGDPHGAAMGCGLAVVDVLFLRSRHFVNVRRRVANETLIFSACLLGVAGAAGQVIPSAIEARLTDVARGGFDVDTFFRFSLESDHWLSVLMPIDMSTIVASIEHFIDVAGKAGGWNEHPYLGLPVFAFVVVACTIKKHRRLAAFGVFVAIISTGDQLPAVPLLFELPTPLSWFRYPIKYFVVVSLVFVLVAVRVATDARIESVCRKMRFSLAASTGGALALMGALWWFRQVLDVEVGPSIGPGPQHPLLSEWLLSRTAESLAYAVAVLLLLFTVRRNVVPIVLCASVFLPSMAFVDVGDRFDDVPSARHDDDERTCNDDAAFGQGLVIAFGDEETGAWSTALTLAAFSMSDFNSCQHVRVGVGYSPLRTVEQRSAERLVAVHDVDAARVLGCDSILTRDSDGSLLVGKKIPVPNPLPSVFPVRAHSYVEPMPRPASVYERENQKELFRNSFDEGVLSAAVFSEAQLDGTLGVVAIDDYESHDDEIRVRFEPNSGAGIVAVNTTYRLGFTAVQAGDTIPLVRVAGILLGAIVREPANGEVIFRYEPPYYRRAVAISLTALTLALLISFVVARRGGRDKP